MDLSALTDAELDALQLAVNTEIGVRLQKARAAQRLARVLESASSDGYSRNDIDNAVTEAIALAKLPEPEPVYVAPPNPQFKSRRAPRANRRTGGFRATTISTTPTSSPGDVNGAG
ncbi:hypothetical protein PBI_BEAGLE_44 [Arthrobacter phage Beagle]|nr:hypothetical protein PBI_BEAGLE_44 [Arthrobacter phage Beagle]QOP66875.1 hypothetical protein SEA_ODYSSEY395_45 [Arthrobacter phage Odyssey395]